MKTPPRPRVPDGVRGLPRQYAPQTAPAAAGAPGKGRSRQASVWSSSKRATQNRDAGDSPKSIATPRRLPVATKSSRSAKPEAYSPVESLERVARERRRAQWRLLARRFLWVLGILVAVGIAVWVALFSPLFAIQKERIDIAAPEGIDVAQIVAATDTVVGTSMFLADLDGLSEAIVVNPRIEDVSITRSWPDGLDIAVTERVPVAAIRTDKTFDLVGADGVVIANVAEVPEATVILTSDGEITSSVLADMAKILKVLSPPLREQVKEFSYSGGLFILTLDGGATANWGDSSQLQFKNDVLQLLIEQRPSQVYDVSDPARPSVR